MKIYRQHGDVTWARRLTLEFEIYRQHGDVTWARRPTTESSEEAAEGAEKGVSRGEEAGAGGRGKRTEEAADEVTQRRQQRR